MRRRFEVWGEILAIAAIYFVAGKVGLSLAFVNASATAVWPPTGLALGALLLWGYRLWPGIFLGALLVNLTTPGNPLAPFGFSTVADLSIAAGNTLEALLGAWLVKRFAHGTRAFDRARDVVKFVLLAATLSTAVSATIGVTSLCLAREASWQKFVSIWFTWWLGDMVGDLVFASLLLIYAAEPAVRIKRNQALEAASLLALAVLVGMLLFGEIVPRDTANQFKYLAVLPLLLAAFRFGQRGAITAAFILSGLALGGTLSGVGPFVTADPNQSLLLLQAFAATMTITSLMVAGLVAESKRFEQRLQVKDAVSSVLAEAPTLREATPKIIQAICEAGEWDLGVIWRVERRANESESTDVNADARPLALSTSPKLFSKSNTTEENETAAEETPRATFQQSGTATALRCVEVWSAPSIKASEFEEISRQRSFTSGIGLPGRVWSSGQPAWIPDVAKDHNFPRSPVARKEGLRAGVCFPIKAASEVLGVLECFSRRVREPDEDFLQMLDHIGQQLGQFIIRKQAEETHRELLRREQVARAIAAEAKAEVEQQLAARRQTEEALGRWVGAPLPEETRSALKRYSFAVVAVTVALLLRLLFHPLLGNQLTLVTVYGAVAFTVWYGGWGPALFACVSSYLAASWLFMGPQLTWHFGLANLTGLSLYLASCSAVIAIGEVLRRARRHAHASASLAVARQKQVQTEMAEREKTQAALRDREAQLRGITDITPLMLTRCSRDLRYLFVNRAYAAMLGLSPEQIIGKPVAEIIGTAAFDTIRPHVEKVLQDQPVEYEAEVPFARVGPRFLRVIYQPDTDAHGKVVGWIASINDITERHQVEKAHRQSEERARRILETTMDAVVTTDAKGTITDWNPQAEQIFGWTATQVIGRSFAQTLIPARYREVYERRVRRYADRGTGPKLDRRVEIYALRRDGREFPAELVVASVAFEGHIYFSAFMRDITERHLAEEELRESERRLQLALTCGGMGAWEWNVTTGQVTWSPGLEKTHGLIPGGFGGRFEDFKRTIHPDHLETVLTQIQHALKTRADYHVVYRLNCPQNAEQWVEAFGRVILGADGQPLKMSGVCMEITERYLAERAMRQSEERTRLIIDTSLDAVVTFDSRSAISDWNPQAEEIFGWTRTEIIGQRFAETIIPPRHREAHERGLRQYFKTGVWPLLKRRIEMTALHRDGREFAVELSIAPVVVEDRAYFTAFIRDITERKKAEVELQQSQKRLALAATAGRIGLFDWDVLSGQMLWSEEKEEILGFPKAATTTTTATATLSRPYTYQQWAERVHPDDLPAVEREMHRCMDARLPYEGEYRVHWKDGSVHWVASRGIFYYNDQGQTVRMLGVLIDITARKQAEQSLSDANTDLSRFNRVAVGRELRMIELKKEVNELCSQRGEPLRYPLSFEVQKPNGKEREADANSLE